MKNISLSLAILFSISVVCIGFAASNAIKKTSSHKTPTIVNATGAKTGMGAYKKAYFAAGCFWSTESSFEKHLGVVDAISGYAGGTEKDPTYEEVSSGLTGHREAVEVIYDPKLISYDDLLQVFYRTADPTDPDGQYVDRWFHYTSAIFYGDDTEKKLALASKGAMEKSGRYAKPIITSILPFTTFYLAEDYHQNFYKTNKDHYNRYRAGSGRDAYLKKIWGKDLDFKLKPDGQIPDKKTLKEKLTPIQYRVTQESGTERPFQNEYYDNHEAWIYIDVVDGTPLFSSLDKFDSGTGWPSFVRPLTKDAVKELQDNEPFWVRTEVRSSKADSHLGHVFNDGPKNRGGLRYCINSASLRFIPVADLEKEGYGEYMKLFQ